MLSISNGARNGVRCAILAAFGRLLAFTVMISIAGLELGALLLASETFFTVVKFAGAAYLVWIDIKLFRAAPATLSRLPEDSRGNRSSHPLRRLARNFWSPWGIHRPSLLARRAILDFVWAVFADANRLPLFEPILPTCCIQGERTT